jgi:hypothetical protein
MAKKLNGELFLYKVTKEGDFTLMGWSPIKAKKGYKVLTKEEVVPLQKLLGMGKGHLKYIESKTLLEFLSTARVAGEPLPEDDDDDMDNEVVSDVTKHDRENAPPGDRPLEETRKLMVTQEDIMERELKYIKGMTHKSTLEKHMLEKYQCEIPVGRLTAMKAIADSMIADLSSDNRLYLVGDELTLT